jgi:hypothetical protein
MCSSLKHFGTWFGDLAFIIKDFIISYKQVGVMIHVAIEAIESI